MTTQIEETLNLRSMNEIETEKNELSVDDISNLLTQSENLPMIPDDDLGLEEHVKEMDEIYERGLEAHEKVFDLALNTAPNIAGPIFENSARFLETSITASKSKFDAKCRLAKAKYDTEKLTIDREKINMEREKLDDQLGKYKTEGVVVSETSIVGTRMDILQKKIAEAKAKAKAA